MKSFFKVMDLEDGWDWNDMLEVDDMAEEYCVTILDIPDEYLNRVTVKESGLNIELVKTKEYLYEDWYTNLSRVCEYYAKCA